MKISQILLALGLSSIAAADISSKCDPKTAEVKDGLTDDGEDTAAAFIIQCGDPIWRHLDLNQCFYNDGGKLVYRDNGNAFKSYKITDDNRDDVLRLAVQKLELNDDGLPRCFGHDSSYSK